MKILAIRGKNLASLSGEFEIDFQAEPLASAGLYAITGATGAGKSTLLDALCLALYERTPRLARASSKGEIIPDVGDNGVAPSDPRTILRRGASEGHAEVDFVGSDAIAYRARWSVRRARNKTDGKLQQSEVSLLRLIDSQILGDHRKTETLRLIEASVGLNFDQFTRAVLLAQNDFATFLKASDDERAELLQTLTGTETFTLISMQAFARMKTEKEHLDRLQAQLQDQASLAPEIRAEKEGLRQLQNENVKGLESQKALIEGNLRWYEQLDKFKAAEVEASQKLDGATADKAAAIPRYTQLTTIERVQPVRPLCLEVDRLIVEVATTEKSVTSSRAALAAIGSTAATRTEEHQTASQQLVHAETAKTQAQPLIELARELDAKVAALDPQYLAALEAQNAAMENLQKEEARNASAKESLVQATTDLTAAQTWLSGHEALRPLSEGWQRWEALFDQAHKHLSGHGLTTIAVDDLTNQASAIAKSLEKTQDALVTETSNFTQATGKLNALTQNCAAFDSEKLAVGKQHLEAYRDHLQTAGQLWQRLVAGQQQQIKLQGQREVQTEVLRKSQAEQRDCGLAKPVVELSLVAAEHAHIMAKLAASKDAKSMRATLQPDSPCPVCGAVDHPYASHSPEGDAILNALQANVTEKRKSLDDLSQRIAAAEVRKAASQEQLEEIDAELLSIRNADIAHQQSWLSHPLHSQLAHVVEGNRTDWFSEQQTEVKRDLEGLTQEEASYRETLRRKELAQGEVNKAKLAVDQAWQAANQSEVKQKTTQQSIELAQKQLAEFAQQLLGVQDLLDRGFSDQDWRERWAQDPVAFAARCHTDASTWTTKQQQVTNLVNRIQTLQTELNGCENACIQAAQYLKIQFDQRAALEKMVQTHRSDRNALFEGKPISVVESGLNSCIDLAKAAQLKAQVELQKTLAEGTRLEEVVRQTTLRLENHRESLATAGEQLDTWLADFNAQAESDVLQLGGLRALLETGLDWVTRERDALQGIERAVSSAQAVLQEHRQALANHQAVQTVQDSAQTLGENLLATGSDLTSAKEALTSLKLEIALDDERLTKSQSLRIEIEQQFARWRVWSQLSDLIGSSDGKKFRNFAQQLTLDILLGYANLHLKTLTRRYRLERIKDSLGLLVVDQDMGDEVRSVHSLSGGESFLVSLALALGLASLSSHRVRVESLFIDEGFGSLDADSLRVAMDALDNLQAQGRKVGVISHVQEMTERIGTQVQVKRLAGGLSKVLVA